MTPPWKTRGFWLRGFISGAVLAYLVSRVDLSRLPAATENFRPWYFVLAVAAVAAERVLLAYKWKLLLAAKTVAVPFWKLFKIYYLSNFIGTFLPSSVSADILRAWGLYKHTSDSAESVSSVVVDKAIALAAALAVALSILVIFPELIGRDLRRLLFFTILFALGALFVLVNGTVSRAAGFALRHLGLARFAEPAAKFQSAAAAYRRHPGVLAYAFLVSAAFQATRIAGIYCVGLSLSQTVGFAFYALFVPLIVFVSMIPISLMGIGVREGAFVYLFSAAGMPMSNAFALSLLVYVLNLVSVLPGATIYLLEGVGNNRAESECPPVSRPAHPVEEARVLPPST